MICNLFQKRATCSSGVMCRFHCVAKGLIVTSLSVWQFMRSFLFSWNPLCYLFLAYDFSSLLAVLRKAITDIFRNQIPFCLIENWSVQLKTFSVIAKASLSRHQVRDFIFLRNIHHWTFDGGFTLSNFLFGISLCSACSTWKLALRLYSRTLTLSFLFPSLQIDRLQTMNANLEMKSKTAEFQMQNLYEAHKEQLATREVRPPI